MSSVTPAVDRPGLATFRVADRTWTGLHWTAALYWETTGPDAEALSWLSPDEQARYARMRQPTARDRFVTGRGLARRVVAHRLGCAPADITFTYRCGHCGGQHGSRRWWNPASHSRCRTRPRGWDWRWCCRPRARPGP